MTMAPTISGASQGANCCGNTIASAQIANVRVEHRGRGQQADAQTIGWLSRFFLNILPI